MSEIAQIVAWSGRPISRQLLEAIFLEYQRNGRRLLRPGKIRHLRRLIRRRGQ